MLQLGKMNVLEVMRLSSVGAYLASDQGDILLPTKYLPPGIAPGAAIEVFVYLDSEDRLVATTLTPKARVGETALLEVKEIGAVGAFLDWGLEKDLLVPFREQPRPMQKGERHLVWVYLDRSGRIAASARVGKFLEKGAPDLAMGQEVELTFFQLSELGAKVIIDGRYEGLLFQNEMFGRCAVGSKVKGYVARIRPDGKIDVTLRPPAGRQGAGERELLLNALKQAGGRLPVGDKTPAEQIFAQFRMSKKGFKKLIGNLYKEKIIAIEDGGIRLR